MSYLGSLLGTSPVVSAPRGAEPALEQHAEIESASTPVSVVSEHVAAASKQRSNEQDRVVPMASVENALRAAFEWVTHRPMSPAITAEVEMPAATRSAALELRAQPLAAPMGASQAIDPPQAPQLLEDHERTIALPASSQPTERIEVISAASQMVELTSFESTATLEAKPRRRALAAQHRPSRETAPAEEPPTPARPWPIQVHIGTLSLDVRAPASPSPAPQLAAPAAERPAPSAAFAFSARRHHLRWG